MERPHRAYDARASNLPAPVPPVTPIPHGAAGDGEAAYTAQVIGQDGQKRGLRAGQTHIEAAQRLYANVEWSGAHDRRAPKGRYARTDI